MFFVKIHILVTVIYTMYAAVFIDRRVPYWPIEISRMAASGDYALYCFRLGVTLMPATLFCENVTPITVALWVALMAIAWIDDVTSFTGHMFGVALLGLVCVIHAYQSAQSVWIIGIAAVIFAARLGLKAAACVWEDLNSGHAYLNSAPIGVPRILTYSRRLACVGRDIMMGTRELKTTFGNIAFRLGGLGQWTVFVLLSTLF